MKIILKVLLLIFLLTCNGLNPIFAQTSDTEEFLDAVTIDLPEAEMLCKAGGSLREIFRKPLKFKSGGNAFFLDKTSKEIALFEKAVFDNPNNKSKKNIATIFIRVPNVTKDNLIDLLLKRNLIISQNAKVIFVIKTYDKDNVEDTLIYDGKSNNGGLLTSTLFTQVKKLGNVTFNSQKFFTADASIKIRFPEPPKKIESSNTLVDVLKNTPATLTCKCKGCPLHDFDLSGLQDAFDQGLVNNIVNEATSSP